MSVQPRFFATPLAFRRWLAAHHRTAPELWVGFYKRQTGKPSLTWPESVDEALCYGWIDGIRKSLGPDSYMIRFTPRRKGSVWSAVNIRRAEALIRARRMRAAGLAAFRMRDERTAAYSYQQRTAATFGRDAERAFRTNADAWRFFQAQPPGYRRIVTFWVESAKQETTRARRLAELIRESAAGQRIGLLRRPDPPARPKR